MAFGILVPEVSLNHRTFISCEHSNTILVRAEEKESLMNIPFMLSVSRNVGAASLPKLRPNRFFGIFELGYSIHSLNRHITKARLAADVIVSTLHHSSVARTAPLLQGQEEVH